MHGLLSILGEVISTKGLPNAQADSKELTTIVNTVFGLVAAIAVLMIVINGFRYIAAHGDSSATAQARNGILYALIGLVVTMAAFSIVTFVVKGLS